jgi:hypothetical protein
MVGLKGREHQLEVLKLLNQGSADARQPMLLDESFRDLEFFAKNSDASFEVTEQALAAKKP